MNQVDSDWIRLLNKTFSIDEKIIAIASSFDGRYIAIEGQMYIYSFDTISCSIYQLSLSQRTSQTVSKLQFSTDSQLLYVFQRGYLSIYVQIFNLDQRQLIKSFQIDRHFQTKHSSQKINPKLPSFENRFAQRSVISNDNRFIATSFVNDICIEIYDIQKCQHQIIYTVSQALHYSLDNRLLYSIESKQIIRIFNLRIISRIFIAYNISPLVKNISNSILAFSSHKQLKILHLRLGKILRQVQVNDLMCLLIFKEELQLQIHSLNNLVKQWNIANGQFENLDIDSLIHKNQNISYDSKFKILVEDDCFKVELF